MLWNYKINGKQYYDIELFAWKFTWIFKISYCWTLMFYINIVYKLSSIHHMTNITWIMIEICSKHNYIHGH